MDQKSRADITNYSSPHSILSSNKSRLFIVTGKGGVGKTTLAMSLCQYLKSQGDKVVYNCFDQDPDYALIKKLNLNHLDLSTDDSAQTYIAKKLGSQTVASWIMKTPFFKSLFNMLPGLSHMILLGHLINQLEDDKDLKIVIDSPSTGHALTMLESPQNFKDMFRMGPIVEDIKRMEKFVLTDLMQVLICLLPTSMASEEGVELANSLAERKIENHSFLINDLYSRSTAIQNSTENELPEFLKKKISIEKEKLKELPENSLYIAHQDFLESDQIVTQIYKDWIS